jgi:hypothetical protein
MVNAARVAISQDKPILMDYWADSLNGQAVIGIRESSGEKLLAKNRDEYTSNIVNLFAGGDREIMVVTENSIYIVSKTISTRKIT